MLTPITESNALAVFNDTVGMVEKGEMIKVVLFERAPLGSSSGYIN